MQRAGQNMIERNGLNTFAKFARFDFATLGQRNISATAVSPRKRPLSFTMPHEEQTECHLCPRSIAFRQSVSKLESRLLPVGLLSFISSRPLS